MPKTMLDNRGIEMGQATEIPLILGGHSFISQLGNDPPVSDRNQYRIVDQNIARYHRARRYERVMKFIAGSENFAR